MIQSFADRDTRARQPTKNIPRENHCSPKPMPDRRNAFKARVREWAEKLDVKIVWLGVRPMRNKWASCSTAGHLNFNDEFLELDQELCDYVIVHELLHFSVPNHGKLWKSLMRAHLGDWETVEERLKQARRGRSKSLGRG